MAATLRRLRTKADRLLADQADALRQLVLDYPALPERARGEIVAAIDRQAAAENGWTFVMLSPSQNKAVQRWLVENSKRPQKATILWAELFDHLRRDTGEVLLSRDELAERVGTDPDSVSRIMHELNRV
jgi:CRP-like cAMP-binding protein